jgi:hypothetical protein
MGNNLTGQLISATYEQLVQISGSILTDGTGSNINSLTVTASNATNADNATSASFALTASFAQNVPTLDTGSLLVTASITDATTTFTKGDGSTFSTTVNNVVNATSASFASTASFALNFNPAATASYALFAISSSRAEFAGNADLLDGNDGTYYRNASNISAGTLPTARLTGDYTINITGSVLGNAATSTTASFATTAATATSASFASTANLAATASFVSGAIATASYAVNADNLDGQSGAYYQNADNINAGTLGTGRLSGTYSIDISGDANTLDGNDGTYYRNADNINAGTLNSNRLAGTYTIDIAGNAATATSASFATNAANAVNATNATSASFASTIADGLNINATSITASGGQFTNLVATSASIGYLNVTTGSAVIIGEQFIILNADTPTAPFAGIKVYDTGSASTASIEWNGNTDVWITVEENGDSAMVLTGLSGSKGSEVAPALNKLLKGQGNNTVADSSITDDGTTVSMTAELDVTGGVTASAGFLGDLTGTASNATSASFSATAVSSSYALTASFAENSLPAFPFDGDALISGSLGLTGSFSSFPTTVTAAAGTASVSGYTGSIFSVDATLGQYFDLTLTTASLSVLDVVNMKPGQEIYVRVSQSAAGIGDTVLLTNLQLNSNIFVPTGSSRYIPSSTTGSTDQLTITFTDKLLCEYEKQFVTFSIEPQSTFVSASGGTETTDGDYKIHTFTTSGDFTVTTGGDISQYLIVAGGGGGGKANAGAGGAGGYFATGSDSDIVNIVTAQIYSVVVGAGGAGATTTPRTGSLGGNSSVFSITTFGGGGGGGINGGTSIYDGQSGGSGGGGANDGGGIGAGGIPTSGSVAAALGFIGGQPTGNPSGPGGGGGGAGGAGQPNSGATGGAGGTGVANSITGTSLFYAGGGGGGSNNTGGAGGSSVGGNGGSGSGIGANGVANRGSGGGGGAGGSANGGNGSTGVVIIRYKFQ